MARGFKDPRFDVSARLGIDSARTIIRTHKLLVGSPCVQFWSCYVRPTTARPGMSR
jgi:hypothetical protein